MTTFDTIVWSTAGLSTYLLGALPFGFILARARGVDIRTVGSGNVGATNVFRSVSKPLGLLTFLLDFAKGYGGALLIPILVGKFFPNVTTGGKGLAMVCGIMAIVGHNWSCFLKFKGGKGVATSAGMLLGLAPLGVAIAFGVWLVVFIASRYVSLASILAAASLGIAVWPLYFNAHGWWFAAALTAMAALAILKHRSNIIRLLAGTESRISWGKKRSA